MEDIPVSPRISVLVYTARNDRPFLDREDLHCFDLVAATLAQQTFTDFELVLIDALWEKRGDWFKEHPQPYRVKHIPASPNFWHKMGRTGIVAQLNRGIAWCDGELIFVGAESCIWPAHFMHLAWELYERGQIGVAWYPVLSPTPVEHHSWHPVVPLDTMGYRGENVLDCDHRAQRFVDNPSLVTTPCHHQHYFAYAALPTELALELNGFDEAFDGDLHLLDVDMGSRIELSGRGGAMVMHRDLWCAEPKVDAQWKSGITRGRLIKCGYALWWFNRLQHRVVANTKMPDGWIDYIKRAICHGACPIRGRCEEEFLRRTGEGESRIYPFCEGPDQELTQRWLDNLPCFLLGDEFDKRRRGAAPYDRGYFHG